MKKHAHLLTLGLLLVISACAPTPVALFNAEIYTRPYQTEFEDTLTIVLDEAIPDHFYVQDMDLLSMEVKDFRKSLRLSLYYAFRDSFEEVKFSETPSSQGLSIHLYRIRPFWDLQTIATDTYVVENISFNDNTYYLSSLIRYDGVLYRDGEKVMVLDEEVWGEKVVNAKRDWHEAFKDGIREMCEDLYRALAEDQKAFLTKK